DLGRRLDRRAGGDVIERAAQRLPRLRPLFGDVGPFAGIARQVVQLFARRLDVAVALVGQRGQLTPAEVIARVQRFRIDRGRGQLARALEHRLERAAAEVPGA